MVVALLGSKLQPQEGSATAILLTVPTARKRVSNRWRRGGASRSLPKAHKTPQCQVSAYDVVRAFAKL
jgi:hypothetical protein